MKIRSLGFTLVELLIVIVVMLILMALAVASISNIQAQARDKERKSDVEAIARGLEARYTKGNPVVTSTTPAGIIETGAYPGLREILHATGSSINGSGSYIDPQYTPAQVTDGYMTEELPGTSKASLTPPGKDGYFGLVCLSSCSPAQNPTQLASAFNKSGTTYKDAYIYEPVDKSGNVCWDAGCVKYNLYYISETDKTVYLGIPGLKMIESKHQ